MPREQTDSRAYELPHLPQQALSDLAKAREILSRHGATKLVLYGSAARGEFRADSDLDLGVEGLPGVEYFRALGECLLELDTRFSVVPIGETRGYFRERILREGKVIYER